MTQTEAIGVFKTYIGGTSIFRLPEELVNLADSGKKIVLSFTDLHLLPRAKFRSTKDKQGNLLYPALTTIKMIKAKESEIGEDEMKKVYYSHLLVGYGNKDFYAILKGSDFAATQEAIEQFIQTGKTSVIVQTNAKDARFYDLIIQ